MTPIWVSENGNSLAIKRLRRSELAKIGAHCFEEGPFRGGSPACVICTSSHWSSITVPSVLQTTWPGPPVEWTGKIQLAATCHSPSSNLSPSLSPETTAIWISTAQLIDDSVVDCNDLRPQPDSNTGMRRISGDSLLMTGPITCGLTWLSLNNLH